MQRREVGTENGAPSEISLGGPRKRSAGVQIHGYPPNGDSWERQKLELPSAGYTIRHRQHGDPDAPRTAEAPRRRASRTTPRDAECHRSTWLLPASAQARRRRPRLTHRGVASDRARHRGPVSPVGAPGHRAGHPRAGDAGRDRLAVASHAPPRSTTPDPRSRGKPRHCSSRPRLPNTATRRSIEMIGLTHTGARRDPRVRNLR
jgi:hypothetical protein